jgi:hypothetical protein
MQQVGGDAPFSRNSVYTQRTLQTDHPYFVHATAFIRIPPNRQINRPHECSGITDGRTGAGFVIMIERFEGANQSAGVQFYQIEEHVFPTVWRLLP